MSGPVFVYYWLPGDNDEAEHPNAFSVARSGAGVKLGEIKASFPLPGSYHFRFKMRLDSGPLWMDVTNEDSFVPVFDDKIFAKVLRISWAGGSPPTKPVAKAAAAALPSAPSPQSPPEDMLGFADAKPSPPASSPASSPGPPGKADDFDMLFT
mmetsp:Transcript_56610/g.104788  ORF Transcript_56610/g.104788 Transcript_56610/m.104788 type:complete len:153 (-) Transcript_56610:196-654(-)